MNSKYLLMLMAVLLLVILTPSSQFAAAKTHSYYFSFEQDAEPWQAAGDGDAKAYSLASVAGDNGCGDMLGWHYASLSSLYVGDSIPLPAATWAVASFPAGSGAQLVTVEWAAKSGKGYEELYPIVYVGASDPNNSMQFATADHQRYLKASWQAYRYEDVVMVDNEYTVFVALGWNGTDANIGLDCISVTIIPLDSPAANH